MRRESIGAGDLIGGLHQESHKTADRILDRRSRIGKSIAKDDRTLFERRSNEVSHVLASCGEHKQGFGLGGEVFVRGGGEQCVAYGFRDLCPTGLSGRDHRVASLTEGRTKETDLGAFSASFWPSSVMKSLEMVRLARHYPRIFLSFKPGGMVVQVIENSKKRLATIPYLCMMTAIFLYQYYAESLAKNATF